MQYWFYHLEKTTLEAAIAPLLEKCMQNDWACLVRAQNPQTLIELDKNLWASRPDSWLPHAIENDNCEASEQPILLTQELENNNFAQAIFIVENAPLGDIEGVERAFYFIDGNDNEAVKAARIEFKRAKEEGLDLSYWQQNESGKWEKKA
jgi:DNA polymerase III subunit chi